VSRAGHNYSQSSHAQCRAPCQCAPLKVKVQLAIRRRFAKSAREERASDERARWFDHRAGS